MPPKNPIRKSKVHRRRKKTTIVKKSGNCKSVLPKKNKLPLPEISGPPVHDVCYTWLLMKGDSYLPGIFVSVYSILRTNPNADLVVMITPDVSEEAQEILLKVATHLFYVPYLTFNTNRLKTSKQNDLYSEWKSVSYTKWNMLALPYKKAVFLDGDTIATANSDELFQLPTPAAPFNNPFVKPLGKIPDYLTGPRGPDRYLTHGATVSQKNISDIMNKHGMLLTASAVVLSPNFNDYDMYLNMVKQNQPYGKRTCHSMVDEQSIAEFYSQYKNKTWYNVHHRYNMIGWKHGFLSKGDVPKVIHYFSESKPWNMKYNEWEDVICWYKMAAESLEYTQLRSSDIKLTDENIVGAKSAIDTFIKKHVSRDIDSILDIANIE